MNLRKVSKNSIEPSMDNKHWRKTYPKCGILQVKKSSQYFFFCTKQHYIRASVQIKQPLQAKHSRPTKRTIGSPETVSPSGIASS